MNFSVIFTAFVLFTGMFSNTISRKEYYAVFKGNSITEMESLVSQLEKTYGQKAYLGALKMKLSGLQKGVNTKLNTFKEGRELLEAEITKQPKNIEWRFLRLAVQENAPKIVRYSDNLNEDKDFIALNFSSAPFDLQKIIKDYTASSTVLKGSDFK